MKLHRSLFTGAIISQAPITGEITVANAAQTAASSLSKGLTAFVSGVQAPSIEARLDMLFPAVPAGRFAEFLSFKDESFLTEGDNSDIRQAGSAFKRVEYNGDKVVVAVQNKGLTFRQDMDRVPRDGNGRPRDGWENGRVLMLRERLARADYLRGLAALDAAATNVNRTWNASSNPDGDLRASVRLGMTSHGLKPNRVVIGDLGWQIRQDAYEASTRANHAMSNHASYSEAELARYLGVEMVVREESLYQTKKRANKSDMLAGVALTYHAKEGATEDDPSNIKRFTTETDLGTRWGVYIKREGKLVDITVEHYSVFVLPITRGIRKDTISAS